MNLKTMTNDTTGFGAATALWIASITALSIGGSLAFACAAPLAAIAALAGTKMKSGEGMTLVAAAWLSNQVVGFGLLGYPMAGETFAWGAAMGIASVVAFFGARAVSVSAGTSLAALAGAFVAAFAAYQASLYVAGFAIGSVHEAFSMAVVQHVLAVNLVAFGGFALLHRAAEAFSLIRPAATTTAAA